MAQPRLLRFLHWLRIAVTALSLTACVLLVALWVRSSDTLDGLHWHDPDGWGVSANSFYGKLEFVFYNHESWKHLQPGITYQRVSSFNWLGSTPTILGFGAEAGPTGNYFLYLPHWFTALGAALLAATPWIGWHFSLRTLLIAMTLVAVVMGVIVAAM